MTKPFDPTKPVQTKDGKPARIICTDRLDSSIPIVALINFNRAEGLMCYRSDGTVLGDSQSNLNLVNIPDITKQYRIVTKKGNAFNQTFDSLELARNHTKYQIPTNQYEGIAGYTETVYTDGVITAINFIPR